MLLSEEEAKTKRCQETFGDSHVTPEGHALAVAFPGVALAGPGGVLHTSPSMCIGSGCMAWRWHRTRHWQPDTMLGEIIEPRVGYCGKAGPA